MHKKLFIPGPSEVRPEMLKVMATPQIGHRSQDYKDLHAALIPKLKKLLYTEQEVFLFTNSSTAVMEAAVRNLCGKKVLSCVNGAFAERWYQMTLANNIPSKKIEVPWNKPITPELIEPELKTGEYDCITVVMNETSVGVRSPIEEIAKVMKKYPKVSFCVDAVSCMAGDKIEADKLGIDIVLAGLQKCFALPTGLTVAMVSNRAMEKAATIPYRGYYLDFLMAKKYNDKHQTPSTPAIPQIFALNAQMDHILNEEGLENRWARHIRLAEIVRKWALDAGFTLYPEKGYESRTLTCINNTKGISIAGLNKELGKRGAMISNGYGDLKEKTFRIAHMGDVTEPEIRELLDWIDEIIPTLEAQKVTA
jgi:aspartate aminotransferase-like enzyme